MRQKIRRGFTLAEVIVALAISVIATAIILPVFAQTGGLFRVTSTKNINEMIGSSCYERISGAVRYTGAIAVAKAESSSLDEEYDNVFTVAGGRLLLNGEPVYPDEFYMGCALGVSVSYVSDSAMLLAVTLTYASGEKAYENSVAVSMPNVKLAGVGIAGDYGAEKIDGPAIYFDDAKGVAQTAGN